MLLAPGFLPQTAWDSKKSGTGKTFKSRRRENCRLAVESEWAKELERIGCLPFQEALKMLAAILILESSSPWGHTEQGPTHLWSPDSEEDHEGRIVRRFQPLQNLQIGQLMEYQ